MDKTEIGVLSAVGLAVLTVVVIIAAERTAGERYESGGFNIAHLANQSHGSIDVTDFARVETRGSWQVMITQGDKWKVDLSYPEDLEDRLRVRMEGNSLILATRPRFGIRWNEGPATARIVMPALVTLDVGGAGKVKFSGFSGDRLAISISGAAKIDGTDGHYDELALTVRGAGNVDMRDMVFTNARTQVSGAGNIAITMDGGVLSGKISGAGKVAYYGSVSDERIATTGAAVVRHED